MEFRPGRWLHDGIRLRANKPPSRSSLGQVQSLVEVCQLGIHTHDTSTVRFNSCRPTEDQPTALD